MVVLRCHHHLAFSVLHLLLFCAAIRAAQVPLEAQEAQPSDPSRRRLVGPGSAPPSCRSRGGECSPCKVVHVPIQPDFNFPLEYYPEAWRCKWRNQLFMPYPPA